MNRLVRRDDDGFALVIVVSSMAIITLFLLSSLAYVLKASKPSRADQDDKASVAAAQAGIDEYVARLNSNDTYWTRGNVDCSNLALTPPTAGTCPTVRPTAGIPVPGTTGGATYSYRLTSTTASTTADGVIRLAVTGRSREQSRELVAELTPSGFVQYIYYTDFESIDPAIDKSVRQAYLNANSYPFVYQEERLLRDLASSSYKGFYVDRTASDIVCGTQHWYEGRSNPGYTTGKYLEYSYPANSQGDITGPRSVVERTLTPGNTITFTTCGEIQFTSNDKITGPLKTNDAMLLNGSPWFTSRRTETAYTNPTDPSRPWRGTGTPSAGTGAEPGYRPVSSTRLEMPDSNAELVTAASTSATGCVYKGATRITFLANGTMKVKSPATGGSVARCYSGGGGEQTKAVPAVLYVQDATSCTDTLGFPATGENTDVGPNPDYDCKRGNAYISGSLKGRVTIGTANDVVVVGNTTYANGLTGTDALGIVPQNYAWIYHPIKADGSNLLTTPVTQLDAAVLSVSHSFLVQNFRSGAAISSATANKLTVRGAIAQRYRGPVGTGSGSSASTGYLKDYQYDARLLNAPPPYFLKPLTSPYAVTKVTD